MPSAIINNDVTLYVFYHIVIAKGNLDLAIRQLHSYILSLLQVGNVEHHSHLMVRAELQAHVEAANVTYGMADWDTHFSFCSFLLFMKLWDQNNNRNKLEYYFSSDLVKEIPLKWVC